MRFLFTFKGGWKTKARWLALLVLVAAIANPEVRAFLLLVDVIGVEVVALLVLAWAKSLLPFVSLYGRVTFQYVGAVCRPLFRALFAILLGALPREGVRLLAYHVVLHCLVGARSLAGHWAGMPERDGAANA